MGEMKVEHVLLFLVGAFLVYHMMGKCGCGILEGASEVDINPNSYVPLNKKGHPKGHTWHGTWG